MIFIFSLFFFDTGFERRHGILRYHRGVAQSVSLLSKKILVGSCRIIIL
jgi:hypothetical protein